MLIKLTKINNEVIWLNPFLFEAISSAPDTIVMLNNGHRYVVRETPEEIAERCVSFHTNVDTEMNRLIRNFVEIENR